jgi:hypothetical protein
MAQLVLRYFNKIHILVHGAGVPSDSEWDENIRFSIEIAKEVKGALVWSMGGGPTKKQRDQIAMVVGAKELNVNLPIAFMADSRLMRAIIGVTALLIKNPIRAFTLTEFNACYDFLQIPISQRADFQTCIGEMVKDLEK